MFLTPLKSPTIAHTIIQLYDAEQMRLYTLQAAEFKCMPIRSRPVSNWQHSNNFSVRSKSVVSCNSCKVGATPRCDP